MEIEIRNLDEKWFEHRRFPPGYGYFPYIIVKTDFKAFIQIPIQVNCNTNDRLNYPGIHLKVKDLSNDTHLLYEQPKVHEELIAITQSVKTHFEQQRNAPCPICLVKNPEMGYYLEDQQVIVSTQIPSGGTLLSVDQVIIAVNVKHYIERRIDLN